MNLEANKMSGLGNALSIQSIRSFIPQCTTGGTAL